MRTACAATCEFGIGDHGVRDRQVASVQHLSPVSDENSWHSGSVVKNVKDHTIFKSTLLILLLCVVASISVYFSLVSLV